MEKNKTYTIDGKIFDSVTGVPIAKPAAQTIKKVASRASSSQSVHSRTKKSETLNRKFVKKQPQKPRPASGGVVMDIAPNRNFKRFAAHPRVATAIPAPANEQTPPVEAKPKAQQSKLSHPLTSTVVLKQQLKAEPSVEPQQTQSKQSKKATKKSKLSKLLLGLGIIIVIAIGLLATYYYVPSWSVQLSSMQSGINVGYPSYAPEGFAVKGPVTYDGTKVTMTFSSSNNQSYTLNQTKSTWDSSALLENVVKPTAKQTYTANQYSGITIYTFENTSSWVNGGIMYTIESNVPLKSEDVRRIATSM